MRTFSLLAIMSALFLMSLSAFAAVPAIINYQGKLTGNDGKPVTDGAYALRFAIYDVPVGGTPIWSEPNATVQVKDGLFSVLLGSLINLPANIFDAKDRFFGVQVGTDPEMAPRQQIASVPFAVKAATADKATQAENATVAGNGVPIGGVIMWSGAANEIPSGWALCNGENGTPNLCDRFIVGAGADYSVGATGGEAYHKLTVAEMPSHSHFTYQHTFVFGFPGELTGVRSDAGIDGFNGGAAGGDQPHENRPPYYALCFIMKVGD